MKNDNWIKKIKKYRIMGYSKDTERRVFFFLTLFMLIAGLVFKIWAP